MEIQPKRILDGGNEIGDTDDNLCRGTDDFNNVIDSCGTDKNNGCNKISNLEEELTMLKVGTRVRYIREDTEEDKATGYYPPIGTLGTIVTADALGYQVKWDEGTKGNGIWYCELTDVEEVMENVNIQTV